MKYLRNEPLKKHTSFHIGGNADYFCVPKNAAELKAALLFAHERKLPIAVIGAGTNLLILDRGFRGLVIKLANGPNRIKIQGNKAWVGAGVLLPAWLMKAVHRGLGGLEFLAGIPGSVGGAVVMNAGAWGKEIGKYVERVKVVDGHGKEFTLNRKKLKFAYRKSILQKGKYIVLEIVFRLRKGKPKALKKRIAKFLQKRRSSQPLGIPNAGCIFKNPQRKYAGMLIEKAGCKGMRVGDAQVSSKHANFIVNLGEARARDVIRLMARMQKAVKIKLEPEIKLMVKSPL